LEFQSGVLFTSARLALLIVRAKYLHNTCTRYVTVTLSHRTTPASLPRAFYRTMASGDDDGSGKEGRKEPGKYKRREGEVPFLLRRSINGNFFLVLSPPPFPGSAVLLYAFRS